MRLRAMLVLFVLALLAAPAAADHRPEIYPDGTIVYGDWGLHRPGHIVPFAEGPYGYYYYFPRRVPAYFPSNYGDPTAYRSRATRAPSVPGPRYRRTWSTEPNLPPDLNAAPAPEGPYVIPAPDLK